MAAILIEHSIVKLGIGTKVLTDNDPQMTSGSLQPFVHNYK